jgi:Immunoglobulin-like domain of bacterial spore germination
MRRVVPALACALLAISCSEVTDALRPSATPTTPDVSDSPAVSSAPPGAAAIVVEAPLPGEEVSAPVRIAGNADVFEATVGIRILDAEGTELAATFATATCGSGCRGGFSTEVFFFTSERQNGTIEVFEPSAEDGSQLHLVTIPVVLVPGA